MENFLSYVLDHDVKTLYLEKNNYGEIEFKEIKKDQNLEKKFTFEKYIDYKISFDNILFSNKNEAEKKLLNIMDEIIKIKIDVSFNRKYIRKKKEGRNKNNEISVKEIIINKEIYYEVEKKQERYQTLNGCIISLHTNEKHPHFHLIIPRKGVWGNAFSYLRRELGKIMIKHNTPSADMYQIFPKQKLENKEFREKYNEFKTSKRILSAVSWKLEKMRREEKVILNEILFAKRYAVNLVDTEDSTYKNKQNKTRNIYSFKKLLKTYLDFENYGGTRTFIIKLLEENKELLETVTFLKIDNFYSEKENEAKKLIKEKKYDEILKKIGTSIINDNKMAIEYRNFTENNMNSSDKKIQIIVKSIKEYNKYRKLKDRFGIKQSLRNKEINKIYKNGIREIKEISIKKDYKEILKNEMKTEIEVFLKLRKKYPKYIIDEIPHEEQNIEINRERINCSDIFRDLGIKTRYHQIYKNRKKELDKGIDESKLKIENKEIKLLVKNIAETSLKEIKLFRDICNPRNILIKDIKEKTINKTNNAILKFEKKEFKINKTKVITNFNELSKLIFQEISNGFNELGFSIRNNTEKRLESVLKKVKIEDSYTVLEKKYDDLLTKKNIDYYERREKNERDDYDSGSSEIC